MIRAKIDIFTLKKFVRSPLGTLFAFLFIAARATEIASDKEEFGAAGFRAGHRFRLISTNLPDRFRPTGRTQTQRLLRTEHFTLRPIATALPVISTFIERA